MNGTVALVELLLVFDINNKSKTSGARFWRQLYNYDLENNFKKNGVVFCNISVSLISLIKYKLKGYRVILRVDSLYHCLVDMTYIDKFVKKKKLFWKVVLKSFGIKVASVCYNLLFQNYKAFIKILFANEIIFQSNFCMNLYRPYKFLYRDKKIHIINNGSFKKFNNLGAKGKIYSSGDKLNLVTIFDGWRCTKNINLLLEFVEWANSVNNYQINLALVGVAENLPASFSEKHKSIMQREYILIYERYDNLSDIEFIFRQSDAFISFTYRDGCPNVMIEAQSYGLPVIALESGGVSEIVAVKELLVGFKDRYNHFAPWCSSVESIGIEFARVNESIKYLRNNYELCVRKTRTFFVRYLSLQKIYGDYISLLKEEKDDATT